MSDSDDEPMESMFPQDNREDVESSDDEMDDLSEQIDDLNTGTQPNIKTLEEIIETQDDEDMSGDDMSEDEESDEEDNVYAHKFTKEVTSNYIQKHHQECLQINYDEMETLTNIVRDINGNIIDDLHRTSPILSKYEYSRILGQRAMQLESGSKPYIQVEPNIIDGYIIATQELHQKKIPIIIRRPIGNTFEYWKLQDLELLF
jgi:DNA-directed RNA polymerase subunit K/omega